MPDELPSSALSSRRRTRLVRHLRAARDSLAGWDASLQAAAQDPAHPAPHDAQALLALLQDTRVRLDRRLAELGETGAAGQPEAVAGVDSVVPFASAPLETSPGAWVRACRACGQTLASAFREAQAMADAASVRVLYGSLRAIEKQLWMSDPLQTG